MALILQIGLVSNQNFHDVDVCVLVDAFEPALHVLEAVLTCDVENHNHTVSLPIETLCHTTEAILPSGVPNLHVHRLSVGCDVGVGVELDTDGGDVVLLELLILIHLEDGGLADCAITKSD